MKTSLAFFCLAAGANAFVPIVPPLSALSAGVASSRAAPAVQRTSVVRMGLNPELAANFPRDFANVSKSKRASETEICKCHELCLGYHW